MCVHLTFSSWLKTHLKSPTNDQKFCIADFSMFLFFCRDESDSEGFLVEGQNVGLRMKAMEYWRCSETGISMPADDTGQHPKTKFVIAEALPGQGLYQQST